MKSIILVFLVGSGALSYACESHSSAKLEIPKWLVAANTETSCDHNYDCPAGQMCVAGTCVVGDGCHSDGECGPGGKCRNGTCF